MEEFMNSFKIVFKSQLDSSKIGDQSVDEEQL